MPLIPMGVRVEVCATEVVAVAVAVVVVVRITVSLFKGWFT